MNDLQSRWGIHVELDDLNAKVAKLAAAIKRTSRSWGYELE